MTHPTPTKYATEFFTRHQNRPSVILAHDVAQEQWCRGAQHLMDNCSIVANDDDHLIKMINEFGVKQLGLHEALEDRQRLFHDELGLSVRNQVTTQVTSLLVGIDNAANALFHRLDAEKLSTTIATNMTQFKRDVVNTFRDAFNGVQQIHDDVRTVCTKLDGLDKQLTRNMTHTRTIGSSNENRLFNMLTDRLMNRDGYRLEQVNGQSHGCDIQIEKINAPTVRVEVKAHGERTGEKVRYKEVERFRDDLIRLNEHGLMISLYSGIVSIGSIEIEQLPNGKFAAFLSNNNYDVDIIVNMLHLIYKLDTISRESTDASEPHNYIRVPTEAMIRIRSYVKDYTKRLQSAKVHLRETIAIINDVQMDVIEKVLMDCCGAENAPPIPEDPDDPEEGGISKHECEHCRRTFTGKHAAKSLYNHIRTNKKCLASRKPIPVEDTKQDTKPIPKTIVEHDHEAASDLSMEESSDDDDDSSLGD